MQYIYTILSIWVWMRQNKGDTLWLTVCECLIAHIFKLRYYNMQFVDAKAYNLCIIQKYWNWMTFSEAAFWAHATKIWWIQSSHYWTIVDLFKAIAFNKLLIIAFENIDNLFQNDRQSLHSEIYKIQYCITIIINKPLNWHSINLFKFII